MSWITLYLLALAYVAPVHWLICKSISRDLLPQWHTAPRWAIASGLLLVYTLWPLYFIEWWWNEKRAR